MWWLIIKAVLQALAMVVIGELLRPKPKFDAPKPSSLGDFNFPTAQEGRAIPVAWGTVKVTGPNVTWYGDLQVVPIKKKQKTGMFSSTMATVGYKYYLGIQHALCHGTIDEFIELRIDSKPVPIKNKVVTADTTYFEMDAKTFYGKEDEQGGVAGPVRVYHGTFTQLPNEYLRAQLGEAEIPAYRPIVHAMFEGCYIGNNGSAQPPEFIFRRTPNPLGLTAGRHNVGGDANAANMVYEILTNQVWGMSIPASLIDTADFIAVANQLAAEGVGLSMLVDNVQGGDQLIAEIMRHIDGVLYQDFQTGLFRMALVRDDYNPATVPVFNEANISTGSLEFGRSSWEDTQNTVIVKYLSREQNFTERAIQHQNLANIAARNGQIEAEEYSFLGLSNAAAANTVTARVLRTVSAPLSKVNFETNRAGAVLRPGSVFKLEWPLLGISSVIYRVTEIDTGTIESPSLKVVAVEDVFSIPAVAYTAPGSSGWTNPIQPPQPLAAQALVEAPRALYGDVRMVMSLAARAGRQEIGYQTWSDPTGGTTYTQTGDTLGTTPTGLLVAGYGASHQGIDSAGFTISNTDGLLTLLAAVTANDRTLGESLLMIDNELMAYTTLTNNNDGTWTVGGILQGVYDTTPKKHLAGARVWFLSGGYGLVANTPYASDLSVRAKMLPYTARETLAIGLASATLLTTNNRSARPYAPGKLRLNGAVYPAEILGKQTVEWAHRDRIGQETFVVSQDSPDIGPEAGVTYTARFYLNGVLSRTDAGLSGVSAPAFEGVGNTLKVTVEAIRDALGSYQLAEWEAPYFSPLNLFVSSLEGSYYDISDITTLFQDDAGTIPVTAPGQKVGRVTDKSGRGHHLTQAVDAFRPTYRVDAGGRPYLEFDGVDDFLVFAGTNVLGTYSRIAVYAGVSIPSLPPGPQYFLHSNRPLADNGAWATYFTTVASNPGAGYFIRTDGATASEGATTAPVLSAMGARGVVSWDIDRARAIDLEAQISANGNDAAITITTSGENTGNYTDLGLCLGADPSGSDYTRVDVYGLVLRAGAVADLDSSACERFLAYKAGVPA